MMLKPFQIRDLCGSPSPRDATVEKFTPYDVVNDAGHHYEAESMESSQPRRRRGIVQLSASDYDDIANNHPRARLTYVDNDDGEVITVGSSFELSQRLDDPIDSATRSELMQQSSNQPHDDPDPMHIFDIRRSNSVTELWMKYACKPELTPTAEQNVSQIIQDLGENDSDTKSANDTLRYDGNNPSSYEHIATVPDTMQEPQPLLTAFEVELAKLLEASEPSEESSSHSNASFPSGAQPATPSSDRPTNPADVLAHAVHHLVDGAGMIRSEVQSRLPELERQLQNAQRALPEQVGTTLQVALTTLESHVRSLASALNNVSATRAHSQDQNSRAGFSGAERTAESLCTMASEFGQTLFAAFETEFGRNAPGHGNQLASEIAAVSSMKSAARARPVAQSSANGPIPVTETPYNNVSEVPENENEATTQKGAFNTSIETHQGTSVQNTMDDMMQPHAFSSDRYSHPHLPPSSITSRPLSHPSRSLHFQHHRHTSPFQAPPVPPPVWHPRQPPHPGWPCFQPPPPPPHFQRDFHPQRTTNGPSLPIRARRHRPREPTSEGLAEQGFHQSHSGSGLQEQRHASETLFIGNIGFNVTEKMVQDVFAAKGFLVQVHLPLDSGTGKHAGFGYLNFPSTYAARAGLEALQGTHIDGHSINLEYSEQSPITTVHTSQSTSNDAPSNSSHGQSTSVAMHDSTSPSAVRTLSSEQVGSSEVNYPEQNAPASGTRQIPDAVKDSNTNQASRVTILDEASEDLQFSARYPSLLPADGRKQAGLNTNRQSSVSKDLPYLSPELEMSRFPPVSQLEAHLLANHHRGSLYGSSKSSAAEAKSGQKSTSELHGLGRRGDHIANPHPPQPHVLLGSSPREPQNTSITHGGHQTSEPMRDSARKRSDRGLLRSNTTLANPAARLSSPFDPLSSTNSQNTARSLRRRATERHPFRVHSDDSRSFYSVRTLNREANIPTGRPRASFAEYPNTPGSFPVEDLPATQTVTPSGSANDSTVQSYERQRKIDKCVATLVELGYGGRMDGGQQRIVVYAAAADGKLFDAIDMIEEERKAYEQQASRVS